MKDPLGYIPLPKQALLHKSPANEILFGGAAGPGKSHALMFEAFRWCCLIPRLQVYLFRRSFPELEKTHILKSLMHFPTDICKYKNQQKRWEFFNGSILHFCHCQNESDIYNYQGTEINLLLIDEVTSFTEFQYNFLRSRTRCTLPIPKKYRHKIPGIVCASNPCGIGHMHCKARWIDNHKPLEIWRAPESEGGMLRQYIPATLADNPILLQTNPGYIHQLEALPEPYRTAYKDGNWDIFLGQAFNFNYGIHVIDPIKIPDDAPIYMTFDYGYGRPFSVGWWWVDNEKRIYRFAEWYGFDGTPNSGLRLTDSEIAQGIKERERQMDISHREIIRLAGQDCFSKKPDYRGGGQGPSTADIFAMENLFLIPADDDRTMKIRQFRERLAIRNGKPMMLIYNNCEQFIRTIPTLITMNNKDDIDKKCEDHVYDEACHICMAIPIESGATSQQITGNDIFSSQGNNNNVEYYRFFD